MDNIQAQCKLFPLLSYTVVNSHFTCNKIAVLFTFCYRLIFLVDAAHDNCHCTMLWCVCTVSMALLFMLNCDIYLCFAANKQWTLFIATLTKRLNNENSYLQFHHLM